MLTQDLARVALSDRDDCTVNQGQNWRPGIASSGSKFAKGSLASKGDLSGVINLVSAGSMGIEFFAFWSRLRGLGVNGFWGLLARELCGRWVL